MIKIGKPSLVQLEASVRLTASIEVDGRTSSLWFEVDKAYGGCLCAERSDAFVLAFLNYAMRHGHDISCEAPMTDRLYEQLTDQFLSPFYRTSKFTRDGKGLGFATRILCDVAPEVEHVGAQAVGTGASLGVDSMHVFATRKSITHACIWNGHGENLHTTKELRDATWTALVRQAQRFADTVGVKLIVGNTNFDKGCFPGLKWEGGTTWGNLFCVFALQKLWKTYYIASDCGLENFQPKIDFRHSSEWYEYFLFPHVSLGRISIRMDGADASRMDKMSVLVNYPPATEFLNTCWKLSEDHRNCSYLCGKCMRTMISLDCHDALDRFANVYDVPYFRAHPEQYLAEYWRGLLKRDHFMTEMKPWMSKKRFPARVRLGAAKIVLKKSLGKALRLGKIKKGEFSPC